MSAHAPAEWGNAIIPRLRAIGELVKNSGGPVAGGLHPTIGELKAAVAMFDAAAEALAESTAVWEVAVDELVTAAEVHAAALLAHAVARAELAGEPEPTEG